jgi:hypothetical protein
MVMIKSQKKFNNMTAKIFFLLVGCSLFAMPSYAGQANITWTNTSRYTDIEPGTGTRKSTLAGVQKAIEDAFANAVTQLPVGYTFTADITNVDLAGQVNSPLLFRPEMMSTRVLTNNYFPAITFSYTLMDAEGKIVLNENDFILRDMDYLFSSNLASSSTPYYYEARMVREWLVKTIAPTLK